MFFLIGHGAGGPLGLYREPIKAFLILLGYLTRTGPIVVPTRTASAHPKMKKNEEQQPRSI